MNRRTALTMICSGAATCGAGCLSIEEAGPIDFELLNFTEEPHQVDVTITDESGKNVLEETYEIKERRDGPRVIQEKGFTEATNGETFDIVVALSDREPEDRIFQVTCNGNEEHPDVFFAEIREKRDGEHTYFEFQQSTCSGDF